MATTVTWVQDGSSNYEISSPEHLKQLMNKGVLYTDAGTPPTNYWAAGTSYLQTVDIDLLGDNTDIKPIGTSTDVFYGNYNGGEFSISNWSYVDPNFNTATTCENQVGLFGGCSANVLKNIRLNGVWTIEGFETHAGFLVGYFVDTDEANQTGVWNIECDFSVGSSMDTDSSAPTAIRIGGISAYLECPIAVGITVKGSIDFLASTQTAVTAGGLMGTLTVEVSSSLLRNLATFPSGITGRLCGGVVGELRFYRGAQVSKFLNAMIGDLHSWGYACGGVAGTATSSNTSSAATIFINSMIGNITNTSVIGTGGVVGLFSGAGSRHEGFFNYMTGDISTSAANNLDVGGIFGTLGVYSVQVGYAINAMNGNVRAAILGDDGSHASSSMTGTRNLLFGLTHVQQTFSTTSPLTEAGLLTHADFPDLPYVLLDGTDVDGKSYDFDFVYGNLSGNISYPTTHLIIQGGVAIFQNGALFLFVPLTLESSVIDIPVVIGEVEGATGYRITYEGPTGGEVTSVTGTTTLEHTITGVEPGTEYTIRLYVDTGSGYQLEESSITTTLPNISTNYDKLDYQEGGFFNLTSLIASAFSSLSQVWDGIFGTGDVVSIDVPKRKDFKGSFINIGDTLSIKDIDGIVLPFETTSGTGQDVNVVLSDDTTTVAVTYDETQDTVTVNSVVYYPGQSFILDGKKVTVASV